MIRVLVRLQELADGLPRMRGDDPKDLNEKHLSALFAPHARGP